jgi:hypothetical protein
MSESSYRGNPGGFASEGWAPKKDVRAFASLLFDIVVGGSANSENSIRTDVPQFVSEMMEFRFW